MEVLKDTKIITARQVPPEHMFGFEALQLAESFPGVAAYTEDRWRVYPVLEDPIIDRAIEIIEEYEQVSHYWIYDVAEDSDAGIMQDIGVSAAEVSPAILIPILDRITNAVDRPHEWPAGIAEVAAALTGRPYDWYNIHGAVQGDYGYAIVDTSAYTREDIRTLEAYVFGLYSEYEILESGYVHITTAWDVQDVRADIAGELGVPAENIVIQRFSGYTQIPTWEDVAHV